MKRGDRRSDCPVNFALQIFGDSWSLLVIRDLMFTNRRTYGDLLGAEEKIATNVLASRLDHLRAQGLIARRGEGRGAAWRLTERGLDLLPAMLELVLWGARHDTRTAAPPVFVARIRDDRARLLQELRKSLRHAHEIETQRRRTRKGGRGRRRTGSTP